MSHPISSHSSHLSSQRVHAQVEHMDAKLESLEAKLQMSNKVEAALREQGVGEDVIAQVRAKLDTPNKEENDDWSLNLEQKESSLPSVEQQLMEVERKTNELEAVEKQLRAQRAKCLWKFGVNRIKQQLRQQLIDRELEAVVPSLS